MSEEIQILLAAKSFHELLDDLLDALDAEWLSQADGRMRPGGRIDLASLGQTVFFEQFRSPTAGHMPCVMAKRQKMGEDKGSDAVNTAFLRLAFNDINSTVEVQGFGSEHMLMGRIVRFKL
ncbi:hypothetical protein FB451DRAFT_1170301 [Mycena latifolia]|nr:hypothetical protein FB451DRAFT_1170301 [Mycena latifolia]